MQRKEDIEHFCREFLHGGYQHLHTIVSEYDEGILSTAMEILPRLSEHRYFVSTFQSICKAVFDAAPTRQENSVGRVLAVLSFALHIDNRLLCRSWYTREEIVGVLTSVLLHTNFDPEQVTGTNIFCTLF